MLPLRSSLCLPSEKAKNIHVRPTQRQETDWALGESEAFMVAANVADVTWIVPRNDMAL